MLLQSPSSLSGSKSLRSAVLLFPLLFKNGISTYLQQDE